ncbi:MAG: flagellar biosynthesis protein [Armatimonadetes bacterium]|nr:flagellar biosynthesis protein [Armatimonadota bacterium]
MRLDPIRQAQEARQAERTAPRKTGSTAFEEALRKAAGGTATPAGVEFSKHALERLEQRGIRLDDALLSRLTDGIERAASKGSKTTLVMVDQTAFVVGVGNRTVVTVADQESLKERVFTNIDSMVIA